MTPETRLRIYYTLLYIATFMALGATPSFDYHRLLLPSAERAAVQCQLRDLSVDNDLDEFTLDPTKAVGYVAHDTLRLYLYVTVVRRTMQCRYVAPELAETPPLVLHYTAHYLNISHRDVDHQVALLRQRYAEPVTMWHYNTDYVYLLRNQLVDGHGLAEHPIDIYKDATRAYILIKLALFMITTLLVLLVLILVSLWQRHRSLLDALAARAGRWRGESVV